MLTVRVTSSWQIQNQGSLYCVAQMREQTFSRFFKNCPKPRRDTAILLNGTIWQSYQFPHLIIGGHIRLVSKPATRPNKRRKKGSRFGKSRLMTRSFTEFGRFITKFQ